MLVINNAQTNDTGNYLLIVTNRFGTNTSPVTTLIVLGPPVIIGQPASQTDKQLRMSPIGDIPLPKNEAQSRKLNGLSTEQKARATWTGKQPYPAAFAFRPSDRRNYLT